MSRNELYRWYLEMQNRLDRLDQYVDKATENESLLSLYLADTVIDEMLKQLEEMKKNLDDISEDIEDSGEDETYQKIMEMNKGLEKTNPDNFFSDSYWNE